MCTVHVGSVTDAILQQMTSAFAIICTLVQLITGSAASSEVESLLWQPSYVVSLVSVSSILCIIIIIMACAKWCPKETAEFQVIVNIFLLLFGC